MTRHRHLHRCTGRRDCGKANDVAEVDSHRAIALGQDRFVRLEVLSDRGRQKSMQQLSWSLRIGFQLLQTDSTPICSKTWPAHNVIQKICFSVWVVFSVRQSLLTWYRAFSLPGSESANRTLGNSLRGPFAPWPISSRELSFPETFASWAIRSLARSLPGTFVPGNDSSGELSLPWTFVLLNFRSHNVYLTVHR